MLLILMHNTVTCYLVPCLHVRFHLPKLEFIITDIFGYQVLSNMAYTYMYDDIP